MKLSENVVYLLLRIAKKKKINKDKNNFTLKMILMVLKYIIVFVRHISCCKMKYEKCMLMSTFKSSQFSRLFITRNNINTYIL